ncbi:MAG: polysaccharide biosynthesis tyrosine autokinase [Paludibacteraceae bacterium]|nr:polysaccharide biosynthesis tyrosine autokinase [Paludibacteraceae bacterium]
MENEPNTIDVRKLLMTVLRNWYWYVLSVVLCGCLAVWYYFSHTAKYKVDASIMLRINNDDMALPQAEMLSFMGVSSGKQVDDEIAILSSRDIISQVIRDLDLQTEYRKKKGLRWVGEYPVSDLRVVYPEHFTDTLTHPVRIKIKARKHDYVVRVRYDKWQRSRHVVKDLTQPIATCAGELRFVVNTMPEPGDRYRMRTLPMLSCAENYAENIFVTRYKKESNVMLIDTKTDMPRRAIDFINKQIDLYNMDAVVDKNIVATNTAAFIEERLRLIEEELSTAEEDVEQYKRENRLTTFTGETAIYVQESTTYRHRLAELETQQNLVDYVDDFVSDDSKKGTLIPANLGIADASLVGLINEYNQLLLKRMRIQRTASSDNPVVEQLDMQLGLLRQNIQTSIASVRRSLQITRTDLEKRNSDAGSHVGALPTIERQYVEKVRNRQLKENLYLYLYQKREENALSLTTTVIPAKVIAMPQVHPQRVSPRLRMLALIVLIMGVLIPSVVLYLRYLLNNTLEDQTELASAVSCPVLGQVAQNHRGVHIAIHEGENSTSAELFRLIRTNLGFMLPGTKSPVLLVTSCINGEGKSYVASNIAISLALLGKKVVLVGLDIRKPMLAHYFGLSDKGLLTAYLADESYELADIVQPSGQHPNLDLIPAGMVPPNPNELLQSERLDALFALLREHYDYIIVDTAPVAMVSDTFLLDRISDMTIFVSRAGYTPREMIAFINRLCEQKRLKNMACVLNGVKQAQAGYGYGYGYGRQD